MKHARRVGASATGRPRANRIESFSCGGRESDIGARLEGLLLFTETDKSRALSALRAMRRAQSLGSGSYDPARHAALLRLLKRTAPPRGAAQKKSQR